MVNFNETFTEKLKNILKNKLDRYGARYYSQEGEDAILNRIFEEQKSGYYVDVGAHHPKRFSNTYFFYKKGWSGINIDAAPGSMNDFKIYRKRDINIEAAISDKTEKCTYHMFNDGALNTLDAKIAQKIDAENSQLNIIKKINLETKQLSQILDLHLPQNQQIDFLSVDVEGLDLQVLKSNNWNLFKPKIILVESHDFSFENSDQNETFQYLKSLGYHFFAKTVSTVFFAIRDSK